MGFWPYITNRISQPYQIFVVDKCVYTAFEKYCQRMINEYLVFAFQPYYLLYAPIVLLYGQFLPS